MTPRWECRSLPVSRLAVAALVFVSVATSKAEPPPAQPASAAKPAEAPRATALRKRAARDAAPLVVSKSKIKEERASSSFLRPPGAGKYDEDGGDWAEIPPWRQTSFFGIKARGQFFVYVVDCSGSMVYEDRLARAKEEIRHSAASLRAPQKFLVIFYNDEPIPMPGGLPRAAGLTAREQLLAWLRLIEPDGETDPRGAMGMALSLHPDAIFLLSDGEYPEGTVEALVRKNPRHTPIHCIDLSGGTGGDDLKRIAADSGGVYASRPWAGTP